MDEKLPNLIQSLQRPALYDHPIEQFEVLQTHISWVVLTGPYAYKIKKPLDLGFLNFSTLEKRRFYCELELQLNKRFAPQIYVEVVPITGSEEFPTLRGKGEIIDYAVKMVQFPQEARLDHVLERGELKPEHINDLASHMAAFHGKISISGAEKPYGTTERLFLPVKENFRQIGMLVSDPSDLDQLGHLKAWSEKGHKRLTDAFKKRKEEGFIRECHGDAHLANMILFENEVMLFDCIEFNENLRWIDVMNEIAFTVMDLDDRKEPELKNLFLNRYLEITGDYEGLKVLHFYQVYRALVRAKVACIRLSQKGLSDKEKGEVENQYRQYFKLAQSYTEEKKPTLIIMHGVSGSGKTIVGKSIIESVGAIHLRTDVERKRMFGLEPLERSVQESKAKIYSVESSRKVYDKIAHFAKIGLNAGYTMIADGTFLHREYRDQFRKLAEELKVPFVIVSCQADKKTLIQRVVSRDQKGKDASEADVAVMENQLQNQEPLAEDELPFVVTVDTEKGIDPVQLKSALEKIVDKVD